jgi:hypothetical protein
MRPALIFLMIVLVILPATGCCLFDGLCCYDRGPCETATCRYHAPTTCTGPECEAPPYMAPH